MPEPLPGFKRFEVVRVLANMSDTEPRYALRDNVSGKVCHFGKSTAHYAETYFNRPDFGGYNIEQYNWEEPE